VKKLYLIRHGLSLNNTIGLFSGHTETPLVDEGREQAKQAGLYIKKHRLDIDCIVSSPLQRTIETAKTIAKEINYNEKDIIINDLLIERNYGPFEGKPYIPHFEHPDIESIESLQKRADEALKFLKNLKANNILLVTHGAIGRALQVSLNPNLEFHKTQKLLNSQIIQIL
jgi:broad specificity phosphatase PhoE